MEYLPRLPVLLALARRGPARYVGIPLKKGGIQFARKQNTLSEDGNGQGQFKYRRLGRRGQRGFYPLRYFPELA